jgi:hypothetical protein
LAEKFLATAKGPVEMEKEQIGSPRDAGNLRVVQLSHFLAQFRNLIVDFYI